MWEDINRIYRKQYYKKIIEFIESKRGKKENTSYAYLTEKNLAIKHKKIVIKHFPRNKKLIH